MNTYFPIIKTSEHVSHLIQAYVYSALRLTGANNSETLICICGTVVE